MRYLIYITLICIMTALAALPTAVHAEDGLIFEIRLDKQIYVQREPIWVDLYFTNKGDKEISLVCLDLPWQQLIVNLVNSKGDTLKYSGYISDGICRSGPTIKPTETYHYYFNLSENFGEGAKQNIPPPLRYFENGDYTLQMIHSDVTSNLLNFRVKNPSKEDRQAFDLIKRATQNAFAYYDKDNQQSFNAFKELTEKYPNSPFADLAYFELGGLCGLAGEPDETQQYFKALIFNFPNSYFSIKAISELLRLIPSDKRIEFLEEIIRNQSKSRTSDWAENTLKALTKQEK
jgi:hypothetical protein